MKWIKEGITILKKSCKVPASHILQIKAASTTFSNVKMKYICESISLYWGRRRCVYITFLSLVGSLFLMVLILKGPIQGVLEPTMDINVYSQKINRLKMLIQGGVTEDDPNLIQLIRTDFVVLPDTKPYNLRNPYLIDYSCGQSGAIDEILRRKENGFFIEAGAYDGESISNTLFFEKARKWKGLLIEPDPFVFEKLRASNRKAILFNSCLNIKPEPSILEFNRGNEMGRLWVDNEDKNWVRDMKMRVNVIEVPCFSLYSILLAVNQTTIDYFSLDVEGRELSVLRSIPFEKVHINTFTVENFNGDDNYPREIKSFMEKNGYQHVTNLHGNKTCTAGDALFKK